MPTHGTFIALHIEHVRDRLCGDLTTAIKRMLSANYPNCTSVIEHGRPVLDAKPTDIETKLRFAFALLDPLSVKHPASDLFVSIIPNRMLIEGEQSSELHDMFFVSIRNMKGSEGFYVHFLSTPSEEAKVSATLFSEVDSVLTALGDHTGSPDELREFKQFFAILGGAIDYVYDKQASRGGRFEPTPAHLN